MNALANFLIGFIFGLMAQPLVDVWIKSPHTESPGGYTVIDEWQKGNDHER